MVVFDERVESHLALSSTDGEDRQLSLEGDEALEDERHAAERVPCAGDVGVLSQHELSLAVVAEATRLEDCGESDRPDCLLEIREGIDGGEGRGRDPEGLERLLLGEPVLRDLERGVGREHGSATTERVGHRCRDVLELVGHDVGAGGQLGQGIGVVVRRDDERRQMPRGRVGVRVEEPEAQTERVAGEGEHAPKLTTAEDRDVHASSAGSGWARTVSVCASLHRLSASRISGWLAPRIEAARSAALTAPARPIASVPTGIPAGICTMERRSPLSVRLDGDAEDRERGLRRGHPRQVRGTARAGDDDLDPPRLRCFGVLEKEVGGPVRRDDAAFIGDAERVQRLRRVDHRLPVRLRSHDQADQGLRHRYASW